jgi:hypothetical protein
MAIAQLTRVAIPTKKPIMAGSVIVKSKWSELKFSQLMAASLD